MDFMHRGMSYTDLDKLASEPSFAVYIMRTSTDTPVHPPKFTVTRNGVEGSYRFPAESVVKIGRQQVNDLGEQPNDIVLPPSDRAISRVHCAINYASFFPGLTPILPEWLAFLMISHPRLGRRSVFYDLPLSLFRYILAFLKEPPKLFLTDLGSVCGTYIRVLSESPAELRTGQYFLIGSDVLIEVLEISDCLEFRTNDPGPMEETLQTEQLRCHYAPGLRVHVNKQQAEENTLSLDEAQFEAYEGQEIKIGRSTSCTIVISDSTISRVQSRIVFSQGRWWLFDGQQDRPSVNGTWLSICDKDKQFRQLSKMHLLTRGTEVKVSETVLKVDWA
jgi:pSer/pThr/pTyr-binding forkhead associated (FHA) protein